MIAEMIQEDLRIAKEEVEKTNEERIDEQWDIVNKALETLGELTESKYLVRGVKLSDLKEKKESTAKRLFEYSKKVKSK